MGVFLHLYRVLLTDPKIEHHDSKQARRIDLAEGGSECVTLRCSERMEGVICIGGLVEEHCIVHQGGEESPVPRWSWRGHHPRSPSHGKVSWLSC